MEASTSSRSGSTRRAAFVAGIRTPLLRHQPDARLLELTRRGNEAAFETLFHRYRNRLVAFAHQLLGASSTDAEDVVQEVMVAANHAMIADDREIEVRPWLYKITRNRCLNHLRDQSAARRPPVNGDGHDQELLDRAASLGPSAAEQVDRQSELRLLVDDVCSLPEAQRTALVLREIDGLSYQEVADATETTVSSVKSLLVRARLGLIDIAEGRELSCEDVRITLALAEQKLGALSGAERAHVRTCERCCEVKKRLRGTSRSLAALAPVGLLGPVQDALGSAAAAGGAAGVAAAGGAGGAAAIGGGGATAGGLLAGGGFAAKGIITALAVGALAAGTAYLPDLNKGSGGSGTAAAGLAQPETSPPAPSNDGASGGADAGGPGETSANEASQAASLAGPQSAQAAVTIVDSSADSAASLDSGSRDRGGSTDEPGSRGRPGSSVTVTAPTPEPVSPVAAPPAEDPKPVDEGEDTPEDGAGTSSTEQDTAAEQFQLEK